MAEDEQVLTREQVVALIRKHVERLADLARDHGLTELHFRLHIAAKQAEKDFKKLTSEIESTN